MLFMSRGVGASQFFCCIWSKTEAELFVIDGQQLSCLEEKPTSAKLDMLYSKSLYVLALNMARSQRLDESSVADIHRQYGDHLYTKADYDGAMAQFVKTIGWTQPSYVIRKVCFQLLNDISCIPSLLHL